MNGAAILVTGLRKFFIIRTIDVDFSVRRGEIFLCTAVLARKTT